LAQEKCGGLKKSSRSSRNLLQDEIISKRSGPACFKQALAQEKCGGLKKSSRSSRNLLQDEIISKRSGPAHFNKPNIRLHS